MIEKTELQAQIVRAAREVRETNPMAPSITNTVTINFVANAQIAVGGSAAMVYLPDEGEAMAAAGPALYINVGTLLPVYEETLPRTARALAATGKPWVLDPVAVGIGELRTKLLASFKEQKPAIIRGNASEVIALANLWGVAGDGGASQVRGVDSTQAVDEARDAAVALARYTGGAVAVSGVVDLVTDGETVAHSRGGSHFMAEITGSGCSLGGVCAVYAACAETPLAAALTAVNVYNLAGARAEAKVNAPGSFQVAFLDELYRATPEDIAANPFDLEEA
ncbi:MAG TPA: hydroxyethylthiazole kinase [Candidatus Coprousia avicola]|nr:hydroxyethylthiazole kinase [Candidatus Coprousia avicola]